MIFNDNQRYKVNILECFWAYSFDPIIILVFTLLWNTIQTSNIQLTLLLPNTIPKTLNDMPYVFANIIF